MKKQWKFLIIIILLITVYFNIKVIKDVTLTSPSHFVMNVAKGNVTPTSQIAPISFQNQGKDLVHPKTMNLNKHNLLAIDKHTPNSSSTQSVSLSSLEMQLRPRRNSIGVNLNLIGADTGRREIIFLDW